MGVQHLADGGIENVQAFIERVIGNNQRCEEFNDIIAGACPFQNQFVP